ncbi:RtcB family protein [Candidatus Woesearchaeota archaeon]|nr:MAG: RtcB family protein [Candidatus Woesearchaeota archaeon]
MELKKISSYVWEIPKSGNMLVPGKVFTSEKLLENLKGDKTLEQVRNVACLKGIIQNSIVMPDGHQGYGFPIGGVAAFDLNDGIVSPGGVGYDINCGVRVITSPFTEKQIDSKKKELLNELFRQVPAGVGKASVTKLSKDVLLEILQKGAAWAVKEGYGTKADLQRMEEYGSVSKADPHAVSQKAISRGQPQVGTLGSGNHFLEIQKVDKIYDENIAKLFGFHNEGQIAVMIHSGSRGLGHQVASDFIKSMDDKYGHEHLPDRELISAPMQSELSQEYFKAMWSAMNFAFTNRQMMTHWTRESFKKILGSNDDMNIVYDVCHNIAKIEEHVIDGEKRKVCVHRKGATRSFGPGREEIPEVYRNIGQPVIIPGSMGTASYVLLGTKKAEEISFGSTAHGAGRVMSRSRALQTFRGESVVKDLESKNILVKGTSWKGIAEETYQVYKDVDEVINVSHNAGIGKMIVRLVPIAVMKG